MNKFTDDKNYLGEIIAYKELGKCYREASRFTEAVECHKNEARIAAQIGDTLELIQALNNIGTNFRRMGILDEASSYHYQALVYCEMYSNKQDNIAMKNRVVSLNGIGNVQMTLGNMEIADSVFRLALNGEKQLKSPLGQAINYANLGSIFESKGQIDSAWKYFEHSMRYNSEAKSDLGISLCHTHFGRLYEKQHLYDKAIDEYSKAYQIMEKSSDSWHWLESCLALSRVNIGKKDYSTARIYLSRAMNTARKIGAIEYLAEVYRQEYLLSAAKGDCHSALSNYILSNNYADSVANIKNINHMQNVRVKFERERWQHKTDIVKKDYETARRIKNTFLVTMLVISLLAIAVIIIMWYALRMRSQRQAMMRKMEEVRTNFFTNITHEFRTPLTVIIGVGHQLEQGDLTDAKSMEDAGAMITRQGNNLLTLINQLLDISKIRSAIGEPEYKNGDIVAYLRMITENYREIAHQKRIEFTFTPAQTSVSMDFVPDYINKIIINLLSNAFKFTPQYGNVYITSQQVENNIVIRVADTGKGIAKDDIGHIFDAFYQGNNSHTEIGTGVGLSLVNQIVKAMNGTICVNSRLGEGSVFTLTLPLNHGNKQLAKFEIENAEPVIINSPSSSILPQDDDINETSKPILLIVEDNTDVAYYIGSQLKSHYTLFYAYNGEEGIEKANELMPDLIITDLMMPGVDGFELCRTVRSSELLNHIPIIVITARSTEEDRIRGIEAGADAYLYKPFNSEELNVRVGKLLESRAALRRKYYNALESGNEQTVQLNPTDQDFLNKLVDVVMAHMDCDSRSTDDIARAMCMSRSQLNRKLIAITGQNTTAYILLIRIGKAKRLLDSDLTTSVGDIASKCGFDDLAYFSRLFKRMCNMTPSQYRKRVK